MQLSLHSHILHLPTELDLNQTLIDAFVGNSGPAY